MGAGPEVRSLHPRVGVVAPSYVTLRGSLSSPGLQASLSPVEHPAKNITFLDVALHGASSQAESPMTRRESHFFYCLYEGALTGLCVKESPPKQWLKQDQRFFPSDVKVSMEAPQGAVMAPPSPLHQAPHAACSAILRAWV